MKTIFLILSILLTVGCQLPDIDGPDIDWQDDYEFPEWETNMELFQELWLLERFGGCSKFSDGFWQLPSETIQLEKGDSYDFVLLWADQLNKKFGYEPKIYIYYTTNLGYNATGYFEIPEGGNLLYQHRGGTLIETINFKDIGKEIYKYR